MTMDVNDFRILITVISFAVFIGILYWALSSRRRVAFTEAANLPFADAELPGEIAAARALKTTEKSSGDHS